MIQRLADYLTLSELAADLGVSRKRAYQLLAIYKVPSTKLSTGALLISKRHVKRIPKIRPTGRPAKVRTTKSR